MVVVEVKRVKERVNVGGSGLVGRNLEKEWKEVCDGR
jgi:hypothetical protein